jgi:hypothetical protein
VNILFKNYFLHKPAIESAIIIKEKKFIFFNTRTNEMLNILNECTYPHLFGMMFGHP